MCGIYISYKVHTTFSLFAFTDARCFIFVGLDMEFGRIKSYLKFVGFAYSQVLSQRVCSRVIDLSVRSGVWHILRCQMYKLIIFILLFCVVHRSIRKGLAWGTRLLIRVLNGLQNAVLAPNKRKAVLAKSQIIMFSSLLKFPEEWRWCLSVHVYSGSK